MRGDVYRLKKPRNTVGHEQDGARFAIIMQSNALMSLSTALAVPTSTSARPTDFRPPVVINGLSTYALPEQLTAIDPQRLGERVGALSFEELRAVEAALRDVLAL